MSTFSPKTRKTPAFVAPVGASQLSDSAVEFDRLLRFEEAQRRALPNSRRTARAWAWLKRKADLG